LTCAINLKKTAFWIYMSCVAAFSATMPFTSTKEITSNDIYSLAGHGDTLWMITKLGANFTFAKADSFSWQGYITDSLNGVITFGNSTALMCLWTGSKNVTSEYSVAANSLWLHSHDGNSDKIIDPGFIKADSLAFTKIASSADFSAIDAAWSEGFFWLACKDGGILRIKTSGDSAIAVFPGSRKWFSPSKLMDSSASGIPSKFPDTAKQVIAIAIRDSLSGSPLIWAATPEKLWKFTSADTLWDSVPAAFSDPELSLKGYKNVFVNDNGDSMRLFANIEVTRHSSVYDTVISGFFKYYPDARAWTMVMEQMPTAVTFGNKAEVYVLADNQFNLYKDEYGTFNPQYTTKVIQKRMTTGSGADYPGSVNDILYLPQADGKASFWIASSTTSLPTLNGLFFSLDEKQDEIDTVAFNYVHRDKKIKSSLTESYAYPGIINSANSGKAVFAYNLSKTTKVTIRIFDWNMDMVKTVIRDRQRYAGNTQTTGRSSVVSEDYWDGTNTYGKRVAVGVYYYKITAESGEHAFGKIIVAK
jgi:hypothetical protein